MGLDDRPPIVDLYARARTGEVRRLLAMATIGLTDERADALALWYRSDPSRRVLLGWADDGHVIGVVGAHLVLPDVCEVRELAVATAYRRRGIARRLVEAAADRLRAKAIRADTDGDATGFWAAAGFALRPIGTVHGHDRFRAERHHPPEPPGFFTSPRTAAHGPRSLVVELPPAGNTLPVLPAALVGRDDLPAFVVAWVVDADEVGRMMQDLAPHRMPPVTPAVRPGDRRDAVGPVTRAVGLHADGTAAGEHDLIPGLPKGVTVPMELLRVVEMAARVGAWLDAGHRVRAWAEAAGLGDMPWVEPE